MYLCSMKRLLLLLLYIVALLPSKAQSNDKLPQPEATFSLPEVTVSGMKRPIKSTISHSMGLPSFMFTENHPKLKLFRDLNMLLNNIGVKRGTGEYGPIYFYAQIVVVDSKGEIDPVPPISISPSDIKQLDFYRTKIQDPDIVVIQLKQKSAPH